MTSGIGGAPHRQALQHEPVVIWTRGREDWNLDLRALPVSVRKKILHLPCTEVVATKLANVTLKRLRQAAVSKNIVVLCTSPKAAKIALASKSLNHLLRRATYWMTFGPTTTQYLRSKGIKVTRPRGCESSADLFHHLQGRGDANLTFVVLRAKDPAFDLGRALKDVGLQAIDLVLYKTLAQMTDLAGKSISQPLRQALRAEVQGVVAFASPSAVRGFVQELAKKDSTSEPNQRRPAWRKNFIAVCIGPTTAAAARKNFVDVRVAKKSTIGELARATEAALRSISISP